MSVGKIKFETEMKFKNDDGKEIICQPDVEYDIEKAEEATNAHLYVINTPDGQVLYVEMKAEEEEPRNDDFDSEDNEAVSDDMEYENEDTPVEIPEDKETEATDAENTTDMNQE